MFVFPHTLLSFEHVPRVFQPNCNGANERNMDIKVNGELLWEAVNVFATAGCETAMFLEKEVAADADGIIQVKLTRHEAGNDRPMVSLLVVA